MRSSYIIIAQHLVCSFWIFFFDSLKAETESDLSVTAFPFSVPPLIEIFLLFFYQTSLVYFSFVICFPLLFFPSFSEKDNNAVILAFNPEPWVEWFLSQAMTFFIYNCLYLLLCKVPVSFYSQNGPEYNDQRIQYLSFTLI